MPSLVQSREKLHITIQMKLQYKISQVRYKYIDIEIKTSLA